MNKKMLIIIGIFMLLTTIVGAMAYDGDKVGEPSNFLEHITVIDGNLLHEEIAMPPFLDTIKNYFKGKQSLNFADMSASKVEQGDYACSLTSVHGSFDKKANQQIKSGTQCQVGSFIIYKADGGELQKGKLLFEKAWKKTSTSDIPELSNYWVNDYAFQYSYACYSCEFSITDDYEKSCLSKDKTECVSTSDSSCGTDYVYQKSCLSKIEETTTTQPISNDPSIKIVSAKTTKSTYEVGDKVIITGVAEINKDVNGGVIESSLVYKSYSTKQPLSIISKSATDKGVCGDELTTGVTFNADTGDKIAFTLKMTAKESGKYNVKVISAEGCGKGIVTDKTVSFTVKEKTTTENTETETETDEADVCEDGTYNCHFDFEDDNVNEGDIPLNPNTNEDITDADDIIGDSNTVIKTPNIITETEKYFDYENNPNVAYGLTAMLFLIVSLIIYLVFGGKKKGGL